MREVLDKTLRRADELAARAAQLVEDGEMIGARDRQQRPRGMGRRAQRVELARIVNECGKLARSVGDGERLRRSRRRRYGGEVAISRSVSFKTSLSAVLRNGPKL
jgi:hypothetical protein